MPTKARDQGWKELDTKPHQDHVTAKGMNSMTLITVLFTSSFRCLKRLKIPDAKAAVEKEWWKLKKIPAWQLTKVRNKKEVIDEARNKGRKVHFASLKDGSLSSQEFGVGASISKITRSSCTPRWHCERWFWISCSIHWTRIISITNDSSESHGHHIQIARVHRISSWRSICWYSGQNGRC